MDEPLAPAPTVPADRSRILLLFVLAGLALVALARVVAFAGNLSRVPSDQMMPDIFYLTGYLAMAGGMAAAAVWHRNLSGGARVALLIGAGYFLFTGGALFTVR
ncbi:MAG TPA: hypothetical protein VM241_06310 [Candidatus Thermoplasmatota archaeon]|nr:hypothetical protein [Candidatus Thermoplasmatota archaeon]